MALKVKRQLEKKNSSSKNEEKLETRKYGFELKGIDSDSDKDNFIVTGYATKFFGIDSYGDRIIPGAYLETIAKNADGLPAFVMHNSYDLTVGLWFEMKEDEIGLLVKCRLPKKDSFVDGRLVPQIEVKAVNALSIGFRATKVSFEEIDGDMIRILEKIDLREISFINKGMQADEGALLTDLKKKDEKQSDEEFMYNSMVDSYRKGASEEVKQKIIEFYHEKGKKNPFDDESLVSKEELRIMSKSNRVYAIRELKLSATASNFLAELVKGTPMSDDDSSQGKNKDKGSTESKGDKSSETPEENESFNNALGDLITTLKPK